jgi:hypothetical protein
MHPGSLGSNDRIKSFIGDFLMQVISGAGGLVPEFRQSAGACTGFGGS